jgi:hypothetical protein
MFEPCQVTIDPSIPGSPRCFSSSFWRWCANEISCDRGIWLAYSRYDFPNHMPFQNPRSILRAVLLLVPGISPEAIGASDPPVSSAYPIAIGGGETSKIPAINSCYSHACPTRATGEPTKMHSVLTTLLQSPVSGEQKRKRLLERQQQS